MACRFCGADTDASGRCTLFKRKSSRPVPKRITVHVFDAYGARQGTVTRTNLVAGGHRPPIVRVSKLERECLNISGQGWSVLLGEKAKLPADLKPAT